MAEFEISGKNYRSQRMDAKRQFHVLRRLGPVMTSVGQLQEILQGLAPEAEIEGAPKKPEPTIGDLFKAVEPFSKAMAELSDDAADYVIDACMSLVTREEGPGRGWPKIWNKAIGRPQFDDIDMPTMLRITFEVLRDAFSSFFPAPRPALSP